MRKRNIFSVALVLVIAIPFLGLHLNLIIADALAASSRAQLVKPLGAHPSGFGDLPYVEDALPQGNSIVDYMLYDHHGGTWCDAEKTKDNTDDDLMCWAAAASNVLEWTGWGLTSGMWNTDEMFQHCLNYWDDRTGWMTSAWQWWFDGSLADVPGGGNFWPGYTLANYLQEEYDAALALQSIDDYLHAGYGVAIGIWDGGHVITCWGFQYDDSVDKAAHPEDYYLGVWVTDSDDDKWWTGPAADAPNNLRYLSVDWNGTHWNLVGGYGGWHISGVCALEPFPSARPVANAGGPYTGDEGSVITFNGSTSSDADGDLLKYRWDFDNNGVWDTGWSLSPTASHTWYDNFSGESVVLQVYDGHMFDIDTATVTVSNVVPIVSAGPDQTVNEGHIVSFSGSFTDLGTSDTHTIEWDFGDGSPISTGTLTPSHVYGDDEVYTVTLTVTDDDGDWDTDTITVTVNNVSPTATIDLMTQPNPQFILPIVHPLTFNGSFIDLGWLDTHTVLWDFGDGAIVAGTLTEENIEPAATGTTTIHHTYSEPGTYTVTLTVTDDDGDVGTDTMQVIVLSAQEAKEHINKYIQTLSDSTFKSNPSQRKNALNSMFAAIDTMLDNGEYRGAIQSLQNNIQTKANGFVDGTLNNDWIIDSVAQQEICMKIDDLIAYLETFL